jgi:hypothetical protein
MCDPTKIRKTKEEEEEGKWLMMMQQLAQRRTHQKDKKGPLSCCVPLCL